MKIRVGFVSNSSSSSFICDFCGEEQSGMDMSLYEAGMLECENGHTFCATHAILGSLKDKKGTVLSQLSNGNIDDVVDSLNLENTDDPVSWENCPLCNFTKVAQFDLISYLLKKTGKNRSEIEEEIRLRYSDYASFTRDILK